MSCQEHKLAGLLRSVLSDTEEGTIDREQLARDVWSCIRGHQVRASAPRPGISVFRGVRGKPEQVAGLHEPPSEMAKRGRANTRGQPVFYGTRDRRAVFFELEAEPGEDITVCEWRTVERMVANVVPAPDRRMPGCPEPLPESGPMLQALAEAFTKKGEDAYELTSLLAEQMMRGDAIHALMYPALAMHSNAANLAIKPSFRKSSMRPVRAEHLVVREREGMQYTVQAIDTATAFDSAGKIRWKGHVDRWRMRQSGVLTFRVENGRWIARDASGQIVDPDE